MRASDGTSRMLYTYIRSCINTGMQHSRSALINTVPDISAQHSRSTRINTVPDISAQHSRSARINTLLILRRRWKCCIPLRIREQLSPDQKTPGAPGPWSSRRWSRWRGGISGARRAGGGAGAPARPAGNGRRGRTTRSARRLPQDAVMVG